MTFSFDEKDPLECARAERVVKDMLARGYLLFANVDGKLVRVKEFDPAKREYIIADGPESHPEPPAEVAPDEPPKPKKRGGPRRIPAKGTPVTGIAPTAGG